ncbi:MAG: Holliday junction resolvase RuvX [Dehalococcoidia bacterium]|nr:MAG: Holliday junction resolvase RuvX [Dehalococcoidia bacterium]
MRSLGLDIGDRRIGVALSDPEGILASTFSVIERKDDSLAIKAIIDVVNQKEVGQIIVGLPRSLDGSLGWQVEKVKQFIRRLRRYTKVPMDYRDERLTTVMARRLRRMSGGKKGRGKGGDDAQAAAIILQSYLDESQQSELT